MHTMFTFLEKTKRNQHVSMLTLALSIKLKAEQCTNTLDCALGPILIMSTIGSSITHNGFTAQTFNKVNKLSLVA